MLGAGRGARRVRRAARRPPRPADRDRLQRLLRGQPGTGRPARARPRCRRAAQDDLAGRPAPGRPARTACSASPRARSTRTSDDLLAGLAHPRGRPRHEAPAATLRPRACGPRARSSSSWASTRPVCLGVLGWLISIVGNAAFFAERTGYEAELDDATGLRVNDAVKIAGVEVGPVTGIEIEQGHAVVSFEIDEDTRAAATAPRPASAGATCSARSTSTSTRATAGETHGGRRPHAARAVGAVGRRGRLPQRRRPGPAGPRPRRRQRLRPGRVRGHLRQRGPGPRPHRRQRHPGPGPRRPRRRGRLDHHQPRPGGRRGGRARRRRRRAPGQPQLAVRRPGRPATSR